MTEENYLAHIAADGREQTVRAHLEETAALCSQFADAFGAKEQGELAGMAHDIGKYTRGFQRRLHGGPPVDHATAGAYECFRRRQLWAAFAVAGHHGGLPDGGGKADSPECPTLRGRLKRAKDGLLEPYAAWAEEVSLPNARPPVLNGASKDRFQEDATFFTRMLYSCLVDADFLDTETFMDGHPRSAGGDSITALWTRLQAHVSSWFPPKNELNRQRCAILSRCMAEGEAREPGLFTLTVPTGGGKTVASLAFALAHARAHGLRRVIYVIPYTSIIEQTAKTFREILGAENVLEHHSNYLFEDTKDSEANPETVKLQKVTENWDMPVVVTTAVQFFESLYACRSSQCRKLHNIAGSVIIFDEAQMLPLPYLRPCVHAVAQLTAHYNVSAVLCTATQPALGRLFQEFLPGVSALELCPAGTFQPEVFRRVTFRQAGNLSWEALAEQLNRQEQVLCVVNKRKSAQKLFAKLSGEGCFHLSTLMYPAHRQAQLEEIRERLAKGLPCRVVSTSLIEAGVDVDFPAVYREEAGLDSILQAAGRCNREGKRSEEESVVTVFHGEDGIPKLFATQVDVGRDILEHYADPASEEAIHAYFTELLDVRGAAAQDVKGILPLIRTEFFPFRTIAEQFHLIEADTKTIYIPQGEGAELVACLRAEERSRALFRALGRYGVSVYSREFEALERAGMLETLEDGSAILLEQTQYNEATGLDTNAAGGMGYIL